MDGRENKSPNKTIVYCRKNVSSKHELEFFNKQKSYISTELCSQTGALNMAALSNGAVTLVTKLSYGSIIILSFPVLRSLYFLRNQNRHLSKLLLRQQALF